MKLLLISTAAVAILTATSAFAQPDDHHGHAPKAAAHAPAPQPHVSGGSHGTPHVSNAMSAGPSRPSHSDRHTTNHSVTGHTSVNANASFSGRHEHGRVTTTASPAAVYNNAVARDRHDNNRNDHNNNYRGGNNNYHGNNRGNANAHANFNRRNVTASHHYHYHGGTWRWPSGYHYQRWTFGMTLPSVFWANNYWVSDYYDYGLGAPPPGTVWVRYGSDAILIDRYSGDILEVVYNQFY